jgi:hypothetical protein
LLHSDIFGSKFVANSPKLNAGYHVLHRSLLPRHSSYALCYLAIQPQMTTKNLSLRVCTNLIIAEKLSADLTIKKYS